MAQALSHLREDLLGGNPTIHYPDALGFAVLVFDLLEKIAQGGLIRRVAGKNLVCQRKTLRGNDQGNDHLYAVRTFIARVTEAALAILLLGRITLKIRARQIIEEQIELCPEKILPAGTLR